MEIFYSNHAKKRMKERGIGNWEVEYLIKHPSYIKKSGDKKEAVGMMRNREIRIIYAEIENYIRIITVI